MEKHMSIQIMNIFKESYRDVRGNKLDWVRVAVAPVVIAIFGFLFMLFAYLSAGQPLFPDAANQANVMADSSFMVILGNIVHFLAVIISTVCLYINGFRYAVLHEGGDRWWTLNLDWRFVKFILYYILILILATIYLSISAGLAGGLYYGTENTALTVILGIALGVFGFYLALRIGLMFLLVAIDGEHPIRTSWALLKGNVFRFFLLMLLIVLSIIGITIVGAIALLILGMILALIHPVLATIAIALGIAWYIVILFLSWAVSSKAIALVYTSFTEGKAF